LWHKAACHTRLRHRPSVGYFPFSKRPPNCILLDKTRKWAYRAIRQGWPEYEQWLQACYERASAYNLQFATPLDDNEVIGIAESVAKWTIQNLYKISFDEFLERAHTPEIQCKRGMKSKGGGRPSLGKTWLDLGISRATFFRRRD